MIITDSLVINIPEECTDSIKKQALAIKDSNGDARFLEVEIDATHGGYVNSNKFYYIPEEQAKGASSFIMPFQKPVLVHHDTGSKPIGRVTGAGFIPLYVDKSKENDIVTPKSKIRLKTVITDVVAIEDILTKRFMTVSTGGSPVNPPRCSICDAPLESLGMFGMQPTCEHRKGQTYDDKLCYWKVGEMKYAEVSFVNIPADTSPTHAARVVSIKWTNNTDPQDSVTIDAASSIQDSANDGNNNSTEGRTPMLFTKAMKESILAALAVSDDCSECGDETKIDATTWTPEETKEAEELDKIFTDGINEFLAEDRQLPPVGSKEREGMKSFCGPNKTFPVPDCKHAATAMAMLNFPDVVKKYSSSSRAKIASCVRGKAKTMGCLMSKAKDEAVEVLNKQIVDMTAQIEELKKQLAAGTAKVQEKDSAIEVANKKIQDQIVELKTRLAEKAVDMSILVMRAGFTDVMTTADAAARKEKYDALVKKFTERSEESLRDAIRDLEEEAGMKLDKKVADPTLPADSKDDKKVNNTDPVDNRKEFIKDWLNS